MNIINCGGNAIITLPSDVEYVNNITSYLVKIPLLNTENVTNMSFIFSSCHSLTTIPLLNTENVTNMSHMFLECGSLITIPPLNTKNVIDMKSMFKYCGSLTTIPPLDTKNVTNMAGMFSDCHSLTTISLFNIENLIDDAMEGMFFSCFALENLNLENWNRAYIDLSYSSKLTPLSVHNLISQAVGTETRQLTLHADAWEAWVDSEYHDTDVADAATKNIEIIEA